MGAKGTTKDNHKYFTRVPTGSGNYRYFYSESEYKNYMSGTPYSRLSSTGIGSTAVSSINSSTVSNTAKSAGDYIVSKYAKYNVSQNGSTTPGRTIGISQYYSKDDASNTNTQQTTQQTGTDTQQAASSKTTSGSGSGSKLTKASNQNKTGGSVGQEKKSGSSAVRVLDDDLSTMQFQVAKKSGGKTLKVNNDAIVKRNRK